MLNHFYLLLVLSALLFLINTLLNTLITRSSIQSSVAVVTAASPSSALKYKIILQDCFKNQPVGTLVR